MAAASVGPMIWADLYWNGLSASYFLGLVDRGYRVIQRIGTRLADATCTSIKLTHGMSSAVFLTFCEDMASTRWASVGIGGSFSNMIRRGA
jgi:hypothetical protein